MAYAHSSLDYNVILLWNENIKPENIESYFMHEMRVPSISVNRRLGSDSEEENDVITFYGRMGFHKLDEGVTNLLKLFCKEKERRDRNQQITRILLNFEDSFFTEIMTDNSFSVSHEVKLHSFSFGTMVRLTSFIDHYSSEDDPFTVGLDGVSYHVRVSDEDLLARFLHSYGEIHVHFRLIFTPVDKSTIRYKYKRFKLVIPYSSINHMIVKLEDWNFSTCIAVSHPPSLYILKKDLIPQTVFKKSDVHELRTTNNDIEFEKDFWCRRTEFCGIAKQDLGKCNVIKIDLYKHENLGSVADHEKVCYPCPFSVVNSMLKFKKFAVYFGEVSVIVKDFPDSVTLDGQSFNVGYALEALQSISYQFANDLLFYKQNNKIDKQIKKELNLLASNSVAFESSLIELFEVIASGAFVRVFSFLKRKVRKNATLMEDKSVVRGVQKIRRAVLTPTRLVLLPALPVMESRLVFRSNPDYVLRLLIRDDDLQYLTFSIRMQDEKDKRIFFDEVIKKPLKHGLKIYDRVYEVVGSSQSQLRDNGICLYARDKEGRTASSIRNSFGKIEEKNVSKYVARVGLILSQAQCFIDVSDANVKYNESDIKHPDAIHPTSKKQYEFSDGCGMISLEYAEKLTQKLKAVEFLPEDALVPSAFQIRLGGCKGMLVVNPDLKNNPRLKKYDIVIRDSMRKFDSDDKLLGVLKVSDKRKVYLNKPLITVLDQLGIDTNIFLKMQLDVLQDILHCFLSEKNAASILKQYCLLHNHVDFNELIDANVNILSEPFFRFVLDNVIRHATFLLKTKGRIQVPMDQGRTMFGVIDETGKLEYGQVFVQSTNVDDRNKTEVWKGKILVSKFPCMDPGDVRIFEAVHIKELEHIRDCIVFPAKGPRPHPNEMAGSDLDGDEYAVIRYKPLLNIRVNEPMLYPDSKAKTLDREITLDDILDFYANYIEEYSVGVIAKAHLAWADMLPKGIFDPICKQLAWMYSVSLDFAKTGINSKLNKEQRINIYPDFMEKFSQKPTYLSEKALGSLFRQISVFQIVFNEQNPLSVGGIGCELFEHPLSDQFLEEAEKLYNDYKHLLFNIQKTFKIATEAEIMSGVYNKEDKFMSGKQETSDTQKVVNAILRSGVKKLKHVFLDGCEDEELLLAKASAYYKVTAKINKSSSTPYYGLPWIFSPYLAILAKRNRTETMKFENETTRLMYICSLIDKKLIENKEMSEDDLPGMKSYASRTDLAEKIMLQWLERQTHLKLSLFNSKAVIVKKVKDVVLEVASTYRDNLTILPSVGFIVVNVFKRLLDEEIVHPEFYANKDLKHYKFTIGFSSLMTLYRLYRTQNVDHVIPGRIASPKANMLLVRTFRLQFDLKSRLFDFVKTREAEFFNYLKGLSGICSIKGEWFQRNRFNWFFEVAACGTQAQLYALCFFLAKFIFAKGPNVPAMIQNAVISAENTVVEQQMKYTDNFTQNDKKWSNKNHNRFLYRK